MLRLSCNIPRRDFRIGVDLTVPTGGIYALFGPSAAGKSSVLSAIAGFEPAAGGRIEVDGDVWLDTRGAATVHAPSWQRQVGYVEQSPRLFPHLRVIDNILYGVRDHRVDDFTEALIDRFGLRAFLKDKPHRLSGGLKQRVALARALAPRPRLLLLDEPLTALDWSIRRSLQDLLLEINHDFQISMLLVTHQWTEAERMASHIGILDAGVLLQQGTVEDVFLRPASPRVAALVGYTDLLQLGDGRVAGVHPQRIMLSSRPDLGPVVSGTVLRRTLADGRVLLDVQMADCVRIEVAANPWEEAQVGRTTPLTLVDPPIYTA